MKILEAISLVLKIWKSPYFQTFVSVITWASKFIAPEVIAAVREYVKQADTQDGWTNEEKYQYVKARLEWVRQRHPNELSDSVIDFLISMMVKKIRMGEEPNTKPVESVPPPAIDPYFRPLTKAEYAAAEESLRTGDMVYSSSGTGELKYWVIKRGIGAPIPAGYEFLKVV